MTSRDEYVAKLKSRIDQWNTEMAKWEASAKHAQEKYAGQLEQLRERRDEALAEMRRLQGASMDAWREMMRGTEAAFKSMQEAFERARSHYEKK